jgi:hypothetical protein
MRILIGLLALSLLGADGPASPRPQQTISYELRVVELDSLDWRAEVYPKIQTVTHQGAATVWTAPREVAEQIVKVVESRPNGHILSAPKVIALADAPAHVSTGTSRNVVTEMTRVADGPVNHASTVAWVPKVENNREGISATFAGRKLDQGVLIRFTLDDTRVVSMHEVKLTEVQEPAQGKPGEKRWDKMDVHFQVPEVARGEVTGEWLIPNEGVLVVSLGVRTVPEKDGKAGVRERLALLEAKLIDTPQAAQSHAGLRPLVEGFGELDRWVNTASTPIPAVFSAIPWPTMPTPAVPSRSLPQSLDAQGMLVGLPPLPYENHVPPTTMPDSSEPCATPQIPGHHRVYEPVPEGRSARPAVDNENDLDPDSTRATYRAAVAPDFTGCPALVDPSCCAAGVGASVPAGKAEAAPQGTFRYQNRPFTIEIRAVTKPETRVLPSPSTPSPK